MNKLRSQHYALLALSILAMTASVLAYAYMYKASIKKAQQALAVSSDSSVASDQSVESKKTLALYQDTAVNRNRLQSFLVSEENAVPFIDDVEAIGPASGATLSISSLSSGTDSVTSHEAVTAQISVNGTWANVIRALQMVENLPYAVSVKSISLAVSASASSASGKNSQPQWSAVDSISVLSNQ
jgi:hypothetical protein